MRVVEDESFCQEELHGSNVVLLRQVRYTPCFIPGTPSSLSGEDMYGSTEVVFCSSGVVLMIISIPTTTPSTRPNGLAFEIKSANGAVGANATGQQQQQQRVHLPPVRVWPRACLFLPCCVAFDLLATLNRASV